MMTSRNQRRGYSATILCLLLAFVFGPRLVLGQAADWPLHDAYWIYEIKKDVNTTPPPHEPSDIHWFHLHRNHPTLPDALSNVIAPTIRHQFEILDPAGIDLQVRYLVHGVAVSDWLSAPFRFELSIDNPALAGLKDGIHDLSIEATGGLRADVKPMRAFVHLSRDLANGEPFGFTRSVPIINGPRNVEYDDLSFGPGVVYVSPNERETRGFPVAQDVTPWSEPPHQAGLYQELMAPHTELFTGVQLWWDHPAHENAPFVRSLPPQQGEDHRGLRVQHAHERFPMMDGPRGVGWMSPYVSGQVDSKGRLAFAEAGGRVGYLMPDGEILTIAGWRVKPGMDPIWWGKPTTQVRRNMENRGRWLNGRGEMHTPLDIAIDPSNENIWYVASYEDNVIWRVEIPADPRNDEAVISVFAGDLQHRAGNADGNGTAARFNGPASLVFDPINDVIYVADQDNDAIRAITRSGDVTTLFSSRGMRERLIGQGVEWTDQLASRGVSRFEVSAQQASQGVRPDIYIPQTIRVDSRGNIVLLEIGFGAIRRIDPTSGQTTKLGEVLQKHREFDRGWAWLDVDRYGNAGPIDGIYWCKFVSTVEGENFNEVFNWLAPNGGQNVPLFSRGTGLYPDGWGRLARTNAPHYPWLVAVDPRGAVYLSGGGEHGLTRLRKQVDGDPIEGEDYWLGRQLWAAGTANDSGAAGSSFALKYGFQGHNHLGLRNAWELSGATDEELLTTFEASSEIRNDPLKRDRWLQYIRPNTVQRPDTGEPSVEVIGTEVDEGEAHADVSVRLSRAASNAVSVSFATRAGSATPGRDYYGQYRVVRFNPGETRKIVSIPILNDSEIEPTETVDVRIFNVSNGRLGNSHAVIRILDDDGVDARGFAVTSIAVNEGSVGSIIVYRGGSLGAPASVHIATRSRAGEAEPGQDFYGFHATLSFAPGEAQKVVTVKTLDDTVVEGTERVDIRLFNAVGEVIREGLATLSIIDND